MHYKPAVIGPDLIDIWRWSLDAVADDDCNLLSSDEQARAARFRYERDRRRFIVGRGRLRAILGAYLGVAARRIGFGYNAFGKPRLAGAGEPCLHFNLSHSGGVAVLAVSDHYQLGIDIEQIKPLREDIAGHFFSSAECAALGEYRGAAYLPAFYRCWTRKEAFVKAHGAGLSLPLDSFDVTISAGGEPRLLRLDGDGAAPSQWRLRNLLLGEGLVGAVAALTAGNDIALRYRRDEPGAIHVLPGLVGKDVFAHAFSRASRM